MINTFYKEKEGGISVSFATIGVVRNTCYLRQMFSLRTHTVLIVILFVYLTPYLTEAVLIYFNGGQMKVIIGWSVPVDVPINVVYAQNIQFQYNTIDNATKFAVVFQEERKLNKPITRSRLIRALQPFLSRDCLLYLMCESASIPIVNSGIIGELVQTLLTPSEHSESELIQAYSNGLEGNASDIDRCVGRYPHCSFIKTVIEPFFRYSKIHDFV